MTPDNESSSLSSAAPRSTHLITEPKSNDVLLGRGGATNEFVGNLRFRSLVDEQREKYVSAQKNKEKNKIAKGIFDRIQSLGGRFLKLVETERLTDDNAEAKEEVWCEVNDSVGLEKCKQALREHRGKQGSSEDTNEGLHGREAAHNTAVSFGVGVGNGVNPALLGPFVHGHPPSLPSNLTPLLPPMGFGSMGPFVGHVTPLLFQPALFTLQQQAVMAQQMTPTAVNFGSDRDVQNQNATRLIPNDDNVLQGQFQGQRSFDNPDPSTTFMHYFANNALSAPLQSIINQTDPVSREVGQSGGQLYGGGEVIRDHMDSGCSVSAISHSRLEDYVAAIASEDEMSDIFLSILENTDRPRFTKQQEEIEQATMTDTEKAAALCSLFGKSCDISTHTRKRAKSDLDSKSIEFLVQRMRLEVEQIPADEKRALMEAQMKCHPDEFSDTRLERFLRCEGMNIKLGAQRFVNYWECRREVFGPEKFWMRMTLSEALRDDLVAIESCVCRPLSSLDTSGRQLLLVVPSRHTREGYTSECMLRAVWYVIEVLAQENTHVRSGVVMIIWDKHFTIWDYDDRLYERMTRFDMNSWPVKVTACHCCIAPWFMVRIVKPLLNALRDKQSRSSTLIHDPESHMPHVLSDYGILKEMLPTEMGGTVQLDHAEWISSRRAAELKEI